MGTVDPKGGLSQSVVSGGGTKRSNRGMRIPTADMGTFPQLTNQFDKTHQLSLKLAAPAYAVRLIFMGNSTNAAINNKAAISSPADFSTAANISNSAGSWTNVTFAGSATFTIPARTASGQPSIVVSDWMLIDASSKYLVIRSLVPSVGNTDASFATANQVSGGNTGTGAGFASITGDEAIRRNNVGDFISSPAGFGSPTTDIDFSHVVGVEYLSTTGVVTFAGLGDSITAGTKATLPANAHWARAARSLKLLGYPVEVANLGWPAQTTTQIYARFADLITAGVKPTALIHCPWSPNDGAPPSSAQVQAMKGRHSLLRNTCRDNNIVAIPMTGMPNGGATYDVSTYSNAVDDTRRAINADIRTLPLYLDPDIIVSNRPTVGQTASGFSSSIYPDSGGFIHLSEAGNEACNASMAAMMLSLLPSL